MVKINEEVSELSWTLIEGLLREEKLSGKSEKA